MKILDSIFNHLWKILWLWYLIVIILILIFIKSDNLYLSNYDKLPELINLFISIFSILIWFLWVVWTIILTTDKLDFLKLVNLKEQFESFLKTAIYSILFILVIDIFIFVLNWHLKFYSLLIVWLNFIWLIMFVRFMMAFIISINHKK